MLVNVYGAGQEYADSHVNHSRTHGWITLGLSGVLYATVLRLGYLSIFRRGPWLLRRTFLSPWFLFLGGTVAMVAAIGLLIRTS
jgi:hypothetical protein